MDIRYLLNDKQPEEVGAIPTNDCLFPAYWSGLIDARFTERDLQGGVRAIHQFLQGGYRPIEHMRVLFMIALNEHSEQLLPFARTTDKDHDPLVRDAIFCLYGILSRLRCPASLASCIPRWHPHSNQPLRYGQPEAKGTFLAAEALIERCEGTYQGSIWGLIISGDANDGYQISEGSWNLLGWLVELWRLDSQNHRSGSGEDISTMLASQLDPEATLYYPMIVLERAFFDNGNLASADKMDIGRTLFYMFASLTNLQPSPFRMKVEEIAEKMSQVIAQRASSSEQALQNLEAMLPRGSSPRLDVVEMIKAHLTCVQSSQPVPLVQTRSRAKRVRSRV